MSGSRLRRGSSSSLDCVTYGYKLSNCQLDELWKYDMWLANLYMGVPLRNCTAVPVESSVNNGMDSTSFRILKEQVKSMWTLSARYFNCKKTYFGWGLFFSEEFERNGKPFTQGKSSVMGWLAEAPSSDCPTFHRYKRSLCYGCDKAENIYLGGPISMSNFDVINRVTCRRHISEVEPFRNKMVVSKASGRKVVPGQEVLWSYGLKASAKHQANFPHQTEWQLACCSEEENKNVCCEDAESESQSIPGNQPSKKRRVGGFTPKKTAVIVTSFRVCTYCGVNMAAEVDIGKKENMKRHWALKHTKQLCAEMGAKPDDEENPVSPQDFIKHLDLVSHVTNSLNNHNYKLVPACNYFTITGTPLLADSASDHDKSKAFVQFLEEGELMFKKYQVVYLNGISKPTQYEDLLPVKESNYSDINWNGHLPSNTNFSLQAYHLSEKDMKYHEEKVKSALKEAVMAWIS